MKRNKHTFPLNQISSVNTFNATQFFFIYLCKSSVFKSLIVSCVFNLLLFCLGPADVQWVQVLFTKLADCQQQPRENIKLLHYSSLTPTWAGGDFPNQSSKWERGSRERTLMFMAQPELSRSSKDKNLIETSAESHKCRHEPCKKLV